MTQKTEVVTQKKVLTLSFLWTVRLRLRAEGDKLWAEGIIEAYGNVII